MKPGKAPPEPLIITSRISFEIWQFDLDAQDIQASRTVVAEWDGYKELDVFPSYFGYMRLGPDCRIYLNLSGSGRYLHVINNPNVKGQDCNVIQRAVPLPTWSFQSLPSFPNYRMGEVEVCDSTINLLSVSAQWLSRPSSEEEIKVYPNPASQKLNIELGYTVSPQPLQVSLFDQLGRRILQKKWPNGAEILEIDVSQLPTGIYFYELSDPRSSFRKSGKIWVRGR